jgi:tight adherence protein C
VAAFATILTLVMPMLARDQMNQRMRIMATERDKLRSQRLTDLSKDRSGQAKLRQTPKGFMQNIVDKLNLRKQFDNEELRNKLKMAGLRGQGPLVAFMFFRVAAPPLSFVVALVYFFLIAHIDQSNSMKLLYATAAGGAGYYFPNVFIENLAQKRQQAIKVAFPEALDMLLICVQSGMSVESAFGKVAKEVANQSIELSEELALTTAELSYLPERRQAFENLAKRTALPTVKAVTTALIQADRYGTPVGQALRVMAKENRDMRMADAEKKAAALPPKLTVPMIVFFLPVLFLVILGPAAINYFKMQ